MSTVGKIALYGLYAAVIVQLSGGTPYGKYVRFISSLLLFSMIVGGITGWVSHGQNHLDEYISQADAQMKVQMDSFQNAEDILRYIASDAARSWEEENER